MPLSSSISAAGDMMVKKVVIIGAGACGLQCAHDLVTKHHVDTNEILILEARNRIGGRIHTTQETRTHSETGQPIDFALDHGACWVHGTGMEWNTPIPDLQAVSPDSSVASTDSTRTDTSCKTLSSSVNPIITLLSQAKDTSVYAQLEPVFQGNPWMRPKTVVLDQQQLALYMAGRRLDNDQNAMLLVKRSIKRHFEVLDAVSEAANELFATGQGMDTLTRSVHDFISDRMSSEKVAESEHLDREEEIVQSLTPFYMHLLECWHGAPTKDLQLGAFMEEEDEVLSPQPQKETYDSEYTCVGDFYGPHCTVKQGMETVLEPLLLDGVRDCIQLEQEVTRIRYVEGQHVVIETAAGLCVQADACVSTLTVECLKDAVASDMFVPRLGADKEEAISMTNMGCYKKVLLTFDRIFWPKRESFIGLIQSCIGKTSSPLGRYLLLNNLWSMAGIPCLEAVLFGESGSWATGKSDDAIRSAVLDFMQASMQVEEDLSLICLDVHVTRWEEDRFSRGAYSNLCLGASVRHVEEICRPEYAGRLLLAGEGTIFEYEGSVHAALFSGKDAADHVHALLSRHETS